MQKTAMFTVAATVLANSVLAHGAPTQGKFNMNSIQGGHSH